VAVEVFDGDTADPKTPAAQIAKIKQRFGLTRVALVSDRGMITQARLDDEIKPAGLDWITALRAPAIRALLDAGAFQFDLFDERDMASITAPDYPGERLMVCRNPELARLRASKREDLLKAAERDLAPIREAVRRARDPLRGKIAIALRLLESDAPRIAQYSTRMEQNVKVRGEGRERADDRIGKDVDHQRGLAPPFVADIAKDEGADKAHRQRQKQGLGDRRHSLAIPLITKVSTKKSNTTSVQPR
jgi:hypothetical protein